MKVISTKVKTTKNNLSKAGIVKGLRMMSYFPGGVLEDPDFIWSILRQTIMMGCGKLVYQSDTVCLHLMLTHSLMHLQREGERQLLSVSNKKQVSADTLTPLLPDMNKVIAWPERLLSAVVCCVVDARCVGAQLAARPGAR